MNTTTFYEVITANKNHMETEVYDLLLGMVREELAKEAEKSAGRKANVRNAAKRMLSKDPTRPSLNKTQTRVIDGVTYYAQIDGFRMSWSPIDFGFGTVDEIESINFERIIDFKYRNRGTVTINKADVIQFIKEHRSDRTPYRVDYGNSNYILLNPHYLKDALHFTESNELVVDLDNEFGNYPVMLHNEKEDRHALVLPIRR